MTRQSETRNDLVVFGAAAAALVALAAITAGWGGAQLAAWVNSGHATKLSLIDGAAAVGSERFWSANPAGAYPPGIGMALVPGPLFWIVELLLGVTIAAVVLAIARQAEIRMSRPAVDPRWWQLAGRRPQPFGRYRTVAQLVVDEATPDRMIVGRVGRPGALIALEPDVQALVCAAPRTGKSSGVVIPAVLEHNGPVVATSVRGDVIDATLARRRSLGRVWVWNPFGEHTDAWDPLHSCEDWGYALLVAEWLGQAVTLGRSASQDYFDQEAVNLTAPLLHAAAHAGRSALDVYRWIVTRDRDTPAQILTAVDATDALARLTAVYAYTERQRDGIIGTAGVQLKTYGHPGAARTVARRRTVTPEALFAPATANTLFIVAGREHQALLAPVVVTMLSRLLFYVSEHANQTGRPLERPALFALDETAQIAPLRQLPQLLGTSLPSVRFLTVWHSLAQMRSRFGPDAAAEILALSQAKLFLGSITDPATRTELVDLLGQHPDDGNDLLSAQALQRTAAGEGLLIHGHLPPALFRQRRYYRDPGLRTLTTS